MKTSGKHCNSSGGHVPEAVRNQVGRVVLVVGACGLDRLLTVSSYPKADEKVRTTAYHEVGGGNAANTAHAMALLTNASFLGNQNVRIKLLTKLGDDHIGLQLSEELRQAGVDLSSPLFKKGVSGTTTGFTTIVVSEKDHTRTCIHTPGTCGEWTRADVESVNLDDTFAGVVHLHCDARHTEAAFLLAQEARKRGIPVSVDAEKDRGTPFLDKLLELATTVFTNSQQLGAYIQRRTLELEKQLSRKPLPEPSIAVGEESSQDADVYANSILPSHHFLRWYGASQSNKELVITKGSMRALHIKCCATKMKEITGGETEGTNEVLVTANGESNIMNVRHTVLDMSLVHGQGFSSDIEYQVHCGGVLREISIIDTTGAGDAFIGGFLITQLLNRTKDCRNRKDLIEFGLQFGAWVAGKKLEGAGAKRSTLPSGSDVDKVLGKDKNAIRQNLCSLLEPFGI